MRFIDRVYQGWDVSGSQLCVGLDPDPARFGGPYRDRPEATFEFLRDIVDATADVACSFKPQIAYFAALGRERDLERICEHVRERAPHALLILDAKRSDIGPTAAQYAREAYERYGADCVTVNPYLGGDSIEPFLAYTDRGVIVLCRTSNPGAGDLQDLDVGGEPLYLRVARMVAGAWNAAEQCGLVVGATYPAELARVREAVGDRVPLLVPGVGAQGGSAAEVLAHGASRDGRGLLVNSSRAVLYAASGESFAQAAREEAIRTARALRV